MTDPVSLSAGLPAVAYHLAEATNWPAIQAQGLMSAHRLIEQSALGSDTHRTHRPAGLQLPGGARLRDQRPMPPGALARCLENGLTPQDWYALVNRKVYFWLGRERLMRHLAACAGQPQVLLTLDLPRLLAAHGARAAVTPFNVGNAMRRPAPRGLRTFVPVAEWQATRWASEARAGEAIRPRSHAPAELAIDGAVPDVMALLLAVQPIAAGGGAVLKFA